MAFQSNFPNNISGDNGFSVGDIKWSSADLTQAGFLIANGAEIGRATYPDLCAVYEAMGFPWGDGDGSTTFNLPNLIGKFAEGANQAGGYHEAGLPNITGTFYPDAHPSHVKVDDNLFGLTSDSGWTRLTGNTESSPAPKISFNASLSNPIYGNSDTVQPPSALLIPYVKAFAGASADSTDLAITEVANDVANIDVRKLDKSAVKSYVVESVVNSDGSWYRKYSDGWVEQGGIIQRNNNYVTVTLLKPFKNANYTVMKNYQANTSAAVSGAGLSAYNLTPTTFETIGTEFPSNWYACGMGAE